MLGKFLKVNSLTFLSIFFITGCEVVPLDNAGKPVIPMSEEEAAALYNMEPSVIAEKIWNDLLIDAKSKQISAEQLVATKENDKSYFVTLNGILTELKDNQTTVDAVVEVNNQKYPIQMGNIVRGNAIRDATSVIRFDQFKNQIQFAKLSKELNKKALFGINKLDNSSVNKPVEILVALTIKNGNVQDIVPLEIITR